jgi:hypothetical protein
MRRNPSCSPRTLASGDVARVDLCDHCGIFVVHVGPVSLRVERGALESLSSVIAEAQRVLAERGAEDREHESAPEAAIGASWAPRGRA